MEHNILGITWRDYLTNKTIKEQTNLPDALQLLQSAK